jgi:predicted RNA-binding protein with PIN domain
MNVIGSRPNGWWRDRDGALRRLVAELRSLAETSGGLVTVVADGRPLEDLPGGLHGTVELIYASRRGRNAADDRIVEYVAGHPDASTLEVVTSDAVLGSRVRARGASVRGARGLVDELERHRASTV